MTTSTILGFAGAAIGFVVGGPAGAQVGFALGSVAGSLIDPGHVDGPRLGDRTVQVSTYGATIPIVFGGVRIHGNVIWSTDLIEHKTSSSGKGGPKQNTFSYTVSLAILLAEGPIGGIRRVWADSKLIYDASEDASADTKAASAEFLKYFTFYSGTEDQLPDPTMEAALGVGNVPGYRGSCYVVLTDIPLADYGNRIPDFSFETAQPASSAPQEYLYAPLRIYPWDAEAVRGQSTGKTNFTFPGSDVSSGTTDKASVMAEFQEKRPFNQFYQGFAAYDLATGLPYGGTYESFTDVPLAWATNSIYGQGTSLGSGAPEEWGSAKMAVATYIYSDPDLVFYERLYTGHLFSSSAGRSGIDLNGTGVVLSSSAQTYSDGFTVNDGFLQGGQLALNQPDGSIWFSGGGAFGTGGFGTSRYTETGQFSVGVGFPAFIFSERLPSAPDESARTVIPSDAIPFKQLAAVQYRRGLLYQNGLGPVLSPEDPNYDDASFWSAARANAIAAGTLRDDVATPQLVREVARSTPPLSPLHGEANADLADIVRDLWNRAGGATNNLSVTALQGIVVQGYSIGKQVAARGAIQPLQQAFYWDFVESGSVLKAVLRGAAPIAAIPLDELGAGDGSVDVAPVDSSRAQESELPSVVNVSYASRLSGYLTQTQYARRDVVDSKQTTTVGTAVVMTDQKAAEVANVLLYNAWTERSTRGFKTTRKYAQLEPTDVVGLEDLGGIGYTVRITELSQDGGVLSFKSADERPSSYTPIVVAIAGNSSAQSPTVRPLAGPMLLQLLDIPILRDADDSAGYYAAAGGGANWPGGDVFRSIDGGTNYDDIATITRIATMGTAQGRLGDWTGGNVPDTVNTLTVQIASGGALSTITTDQLLSAGNPAAVGREVIQFLRADLLAPGLYRLSGLLRGRRGTEAEMGKHVAAEPFVLLTAATLSRLTASTTDIGVPGLYKAVTAGGSLDRATARSFTDTAVGLRPFSVAQLVAVRQWPSHDVVVSWKRRTRLAARFGGAAGSSAPLGEASEQYAVKVYQGTTVVRAAPATAPAFTYTAAMQAADGTDDATMAVRFEVSQISALFGAGVASSAMLQGVSSDGGGDAGGGTGIGLRPQKTRLGVVGTFPAGRQVIVDYGGGVSRTYLCTGAETRPELLSGIAAAINAVYGARTPATAAVVSDAIVLTGRAPGAAFTLAASVIDAYGANLVQPAAPAGPAVSRVIAIRLAPAEAFPQPAGSTYQVTFTRSTPGNPNYRTQIYGYTANGTDSAYSVLVKMLTSTPTGYGATTTVSLGADPVGGQAVQFPPGELDWAANATMSNGSAAITTAVLTPGSPTIPADQGQVVDFSYTSTSEPQAGDVATVTLAGTEYRYTALAGDTRMSLFAGLAAAISAGGVYTASVVSDAGSDFGDLRVTGTYATGPFSYTDAVYPANASVTATLIQAAA